MMETAPASILLAYCLFKATLPILLLRHRVPSSTCLEGVKGSWEFEPSHISTLGSVLPASYR